MKRAKLAAFIAIFALSVVQAAEHPIDAEKYPRGSVHPRNKPNKPHARTQGEDPKHQ
jgi:hypothetical protein